MARPHITIQGDRVALATRMADHVESVLSDALQARGSALLAVSGGRTPLAFFAILRARDLPWGRITVTLVDERCVPHDHERSNTAFVRRNLLQGPAAAARFVSPVTPEGAADLTLTLPSAIDLAHFGMGGDGHTASWFPGGDSLASALADEGAPLLELTAPGAPEPRVTFTWAALRSAGAAVLHYEGEEKAQVFAQALHPGPFSELPVRRIIHQDDVPMRVFTDTQSPEQLR